MKKINDKKKKNQSPKVNNESPISSLLQQVATNKLFPRVTKHG